jgi:hypothetical protein
MTDLDRLIDAAAREITTAPSPVDLRAKVMNEIRAGGTSLQAGQDEPKGSYHFWWLAAAAGIVLAAYLGWPQRPTVELPPPPVAVIHEGPPPVPMPTRPDRAPASRGPRTPATRVPEPTIVSIPALEAPPALGIAPLDRTPGSLPALDIAEPLDLEQLDIKPLTPPGPAAGGQ